MKNGRYHDTDDSNFSYKNWTEDEEKRLLEAVKLYPDFNNHMNEISKYVGTNRFLHSYLKKLNRLKSKLPLTVRVSEYVIIGCLFYLSMTQFLH